MLQEWEQTRPAGGYLDWVVLFREKLEKKHGFCMVCFIQMEWFSRDFCWFDHFALWRSHSMCLKSFNIFHSCTYQGLMMSMGTWWIIGWRTCTPLNTPRRDYIQLYVCMHVTISSWCLAHTLTKLSQDVSPVRDRRFQPRQKQKGRRENQVAPLQPQAAQMAAALSRGVVLCPRPIPETVHG